MHRIAITYDKLPPEADQPLAEIPPYNSPKARISNNQKTISKNRNLFKVLVVGIQICNNQKTISKEEACFPERKIV
jgi:hypothetical protein